MTQPIGRISHAIWVHITLFPVSSIFLCGVLTDLNDKANPSCRLNSIPLDKHSFHLRNRGGNVVPTIPMRIENKIFYKIIRFFVEAFPS